jgi:hypothetical protein
MTGDVVSHGSGKKIIPQAPIILDGFCIGNGSYCCFKINGRWWCGKAPRHRSVGWVSPLIYGLHRFAGRRIGVPKGDTK